MNQTDSVHNSYDSLMAKGQALLATSKELGHNFEEAIDEAATNFIHTAINDLGVLIQRVNLPFSMRGREISRLKTAITDPDCPIKDSTVLEGLLAQHRQTLNKLRSDEQMFPLLLLEKCDEEAGNAHNASRDIVISTTAKVREILESQTRNSN